MGSLGVKTLCSLQLMRGKAEIPILYTKGMQNACVLASFY